MMETAIITSTCSDWDEYSPKKLTYSYSAPFKFNKLQLNYLRWYRELELRFLFLTITLYTTQYHPQFRFSKYSKLSFPNNVSNGDRVKSYVFYNSFLFFIYKHRWCIQQSWTSQMDSRFSLLPTVVIQKL